MARPQSHDIMMFWSRFNETTLEHHGGRPTFWASWQVRDIGVEASGLAKSTGLSLGEELGGGKELRRELKGEFRAGFWRKGG
jgi:hypothetical protein